MVTPDALRLAHAVLMFERDAAATDAAPIALIATVLGREPWAIPYTQGCALVGAALRETHLQERTP